jgi:hypothetical protein
VGFTLLVSAAGGVTLWLVLEGPFPAKAEMVAYCVGILIAGQVLYKARRSCLDETLHGPVTWPLISAGLAAVVLLVAGTGTAASVLRLALGVAVLAFFLDRLSRFVSAFCDDDNTGANLVLCALGVTAAAPVWLGVWADYPAEPYWFNNAVIWVSPLSYLAVLAEYDYIRSGWFYVYSPFGSLRYAYPDGVAWSFAYLGLGVAAWLAEPYVAPGTKHKEK